jgi:hypothetical protein
MATMLNKLLRRKYAMKVGVALAVLIWIGKMVEDRRKVSGKIKEVKREGINEGKLRVLRSSPEGLALLSFK